MNFIKRSEITSLFGKVSLLLDNFRNRVFYGRNDEW